MDRIQEAAGVRPYAIGTTGLAPRTSWAPGPGRLDRGGRRAPRGRPSAASPPLPETLPKMCGGIMRFRPATATVGNLPSPCMATPGGGGLLHRGPCWACRCDRGGDFVRCGVGAAGPGTHGIAPRTSWAGASATGVAGATIGVRSGAGTSAHGTTAAGDVALQGGFSPLGRAPGPGGMNQISCRIWPGRGLRDYEVGLNRVWSGLPVLSLPAVGVGLGSYLPSARHP